MLKPTLVLAQAVATSIDAFAVGNQLFGQPHAHRPGRPRYRRGHFPLLACSRCGWRQIRQQAGQARPGAGRRGARSAGAQGAVLLTPGPKRPAADSFACPAKAAAAILPPAFIGVHHASAASNSASGVVLPPPAKGVAAGQAVPAGAQGVLLSAALLQRGDRPLHGWLICAPGRARQTRPRQCGSTPPGRKRPAAPPGRRGGWLRPPAGGPMSH